MTDIRTFNGKQVLLEVVSRHKQNLILKNFSDDGNHRSWLDEVIKLPIEISATDCTYIGTAHWTGEIVLPSFDTRPFVENNGMGCYIDYVNQKPDNKYTLLNADLSFASLLLSIGIYWQNPLGENPPIDDIEKYPIPIHFDPREEQKALLRRRNDIVEAWQEAESRKLRVEDMIVFILIDKP